MKENHSARSLVRLAVLISLLTCTLFLAAAPKIALADGFTSDLNVIPTPNTTIPASGSSVWYYINVENLGPDTATNVYLRVTLYSTPGYSFSCGDFYYDRVPTTVNTVVEEVNGYVFEFEIDSLEVKNASSNFTPNGAWMVGIGIKGNVTTDITINMNVFSNSSGWTDPNMSNNQAQATVHIADVADLALTKRATPNPVNVGNTLTYTLNVTNYGPSFAENVLVKDWLPEGVSINSTSVTAGSYDTGVPGDALRPTTWAIGTMSRGDRETMTIEVTVLNSTDLSKTSWLLQNNAYVSSNTYDPNNGNNYASTNTTVINTFVQDKADLTVTEFVKPDTTVLAGQNITYTIIVENLGPGYAYNVSVRVEFISSGSLAFNPPAVGWIYYDGKPAMGLTSRNIVGGYTFDFNLTDPLEPKNSFEQNLRAEGRWMIGIMFPVTETQDINSVVDVFTRTSRTLDPDLSNNAAETSIHVTDVADLSLTKTESPNPVVTSKANAVNYVLNVTNNGPSTAFNVVVVDQLPAGLTIQNITVTKGFFNCGVPGDPSQPTTWYIGTLSLGASATMIINATIGLDIARPLFIWNNAHVSSDTLDTNNSNNMMSTQTAVVRYASQYPSMSSLTDNQPLGLRALELIFLATLISAAAAFTVFKRTAIRRFIGLVRTKSLIRTKKE